MSISDYYTQSPVIKTLSTGTWGSEGSWGSASTIKAAMNMVGGAERMSGDKQTVFADWKMFCSSTVSITPQQHVIWNGTTYDVVSVKNTLQRGHHKVILLKEHA